MQMTCGPPENLRSLCDVLAKAHVFLWWEKEELRYKFLGGGAPVDLKDLIAPHRSDIVEYLSADSYRSIGALPPLVAVPGLTVAPLRGAQLAWASGDWSEPGSPLHLTSCMRISGAVDPAIFSACVAQLTERHRILSAVVRRGADAASMVWNKTTPIAMETADCRPELVDSRIRELASKSFNLVCGPLLRVELIRLSMAEHILVLVCHHLVGDARSLALLSREVVSAYRGIANGSATRGTAVAPGLQFFDYAYFRERWLTSEYARPARDFWAKTLQSATEFQQFKQVHDEPVRSWKPAMGGSLDEDIHLRLEEQCRRRKVSVMIAALSAWICALSSLSTNGKVTTWVLHSGRRRREVLGTIGCFMDMWPLHLESSAAVAIENVEQEIAERVRQAAHAMDLPASEILKCCPGVAELARKFAFFNFIPSVEPAPSPEESVQARIDCQLYAVDLRGRYADASTRTAVNITVVARQRTMDWSIRFDSRMYNDEDIQFLSDLFGNLLSRYACAD